MVDFNSQVAWDRAWRFEGRGTWRKYPKKFSFLAEQIPGGVLKVLDVGCGIGVLLDKLHDADPNLEIHGCDFSDTALSMLSPYIKGKKAILPDLPYDDNSMDVVIATEVVEHLQNDSKLVEEMFRVCRPGGKVIISVPNDILSSEEEPEHLRKYNEVSFKALFKGHVKEMLLATVPEDYTYAPSFLVAIATKPLEAPAIMGSPLGNPKVFIAIPHYKASMRVELCTWLLTQALKGKITHSPFYEGRPHDAARNMIVKDFLEKRKEYDYLLMCDTGVVPPVDILDLAGLDLDVVAGLCFSWQENLPFALVLDEVEGGFKQSKEIPANTLLQKDAVGSGCLLIHRRVLEAMPPPWFRFEYDEFGCLKGGEDFFFTKKARSQGFKVHVHTGYMCSHFGELDILQVNHLLCKTQQESQLRGSVETAQKILARLDTGASFEKLKGELESSLLAVGGAP